MQARSLHANEQTPLAISAHCWRRWWESLSVITLAQTAPCQPRVMPVDIDDTTKLSEEQRKFFSISTGSRSRRRRKISTTFDLPYLPDQLHKRLLSNERQAHTFQRMTQDSRRNVRRKQQRGSFSTVLFLLQVLVRPECSLWRRHFFYARTAHDHDAAPDWRTTLSDSQRRSSSTAVRGGFSTKWRDFESTFSQ